jgi:ankyrin repeat protein
MQIRNITAVALVINALTAAGSSADPADRFYEAVRNDDLVALARLSANTGVNIHDAKGVTPLMYASAFGTLRHVELLLRQGADVNTVNSFGGTALICARGDFAKSKLLLEHGAPVNQASKSGFTPLMAAASRDRNANLIRLLLEKGADAQAADARHLTALTLSSTKGDVESMRLLIGAGADVNIPGPMGVPPLGAAISANSLAAVRLLLDHGADAARLAMDDDAKVRHGPLALKGLTTLMLAAPYASPAISAALLRAGAEVNARDIRGMTPLMLAVASETQDVQLVSLFLKSGARVNEQSKTGETALDWALKFGNPSVITALKDAGATCGSPATQSDPQRESHIRSTKDALAASIALLQRSSTEFFRQSGCVGCHHQPATAMAVRAAERAGISVDHQTAADQLRVMSTQAAGSFVRILQGADRASETDFGLAQGLLEAGYPADLTTDSLAVRIAAAQSSDGSWQRSPALSRAPSAESNIARTALAIRFLTAYVYPAVKVEFAARIVMARRWILEQSPRTTDESAMLLLALKWSGAPSARIRRHAEALLAQQRSDGGWAGNPHLTSDAFATAEALYALREVGSAPVSGSVQRKAVHYLLATQFPDGSWHVRSRAPKFQPYFQSGFPFDHDQWISAAATAWAATALAADAEQSVR